MPKFPPPPRIAQKRSGCTSELARRTHPSAVTTSTASSLSLCQAVFAHQPAQSASQSKTGEPCLRGGTDGDRQSKFLQLTNAFCQCDTRLHPGCALTRINLDSFHGGKIDDEA